MRIPGGQSGVPGELQEVPGRKGLLRAAAQGFVLGEVKEAAPGERMEKRPSAFPSGGAVTHWECLERSACRAFHFPHPPGWQSHPHRSWGQESQPAPLMDSGFWD